MTGLGARRTWFAGTAAGVLLLAVLALVTMVLRPWARTPAMAEVALSDGSILSLERVGFSDEHAYGETPAEEERGFLSFLPGGQVSPPNRYTGPATGLWLTRRDAKNGRPLDFDWWSHCEVTDANGCVIEDKEATLYGRVSIGLDPWKQISGDRPLTLARLGSPHTSWREIVAFTAFRPFRHAGESFHVRVYDLAGKVVAEIDVPNEMPVPDQEWMPEPLPVALTDGGLTVRLKDLSAEAIRIPAGKSGHRTREVLRLAPQLNFLWRGEPADARWKVDRLWVEDVLGNRSEATACDLCSHEPAWRINVHAFRTDASGASEFDDRELLTVDELPVPKESTSIALDRSLDINGERVRLFAVGGPGEVVHVDARGAPRANYDVLSGETTADFGDGTWKTRVRQIHREDGSAALEVESSLPHVFLELSDEGSYSSLEEIKIVRAWAATAVGEELPTRIVHIADELMKATGTNYEPFAHGDYLVQFDPPPGATSLTLRLAVGQGRTVSFNVRPPEAKD